MKKKSPLTQQQTVSLSDISPFMLSCMDEGFAVTITVNGTSMMPFLRSHRDAVVLIKARSDALSPGDVPLYLRDNGQYVLHRVVKAEKNGCYTMRGDNQTVNEPGIRPDQILGVAAGFHRRRGYTDCYSPGYRMYIRLWLCCAPYRYAARMFARLRAKLASLSGKGSGEDTHQTEGDRGD